MTMTINVPMAILICILAVLAGILFFMMLYLNKQSKPQAPSAERIKEVGLFHLASMGDAGPLREYLKTIKMVRCSSHGIDPYEYFASVGGYISCRYSRSSSDCITRNAPTYKQSWTKEPQMYGFSEDQGREFTRLVVDSIRNRKLTHSI